MRKKDVEDLKLRELYVVFECEAREFSSYPSNTNEQHCITRSYNCTLEYYKYCLHYSPPLECYEIINSRFALEHRYKRGRATNVCTFVIEGKVDITVGTEEFRSQLGKFQIIARKALTSFPNDQYIPDFSAMPETSDGMCRFLRIYASDFYNLLNPSNAEETSDLPRTSFDLATEQDTRKFDGVSAASMVKTPLELKDEEEKQEEKEEDESRPEFTALEIDESQMKKND